MWETAYRVVLASDSSGEEVILQVSLVKGHQDVQDPGAHDIGGETESWVCSDCKKEGLGTSYCHTITANTWWEPAGTMEPVFSEVHSVRMRGNTRMMEHGKFLLDITAKQNHHVTVHTLERAAQRGYGLSILGDIQNLARQALSNLIYLALLEHEPFSNLLLHYIFL